MAKLLGGQRQVSSFRVGLEVRASRLLDGAVTEGTRGVVFEKSDAFDDGYGPMVRWADGSCCNVYDGDVEVIQ